MPNDRREVRVLNQQTNDHWLRESIHFFHSLGFFARYDVGDEVFVVDVANYLADELCKDAPFPIKFLDLVLLKYDTDRVCWDDLETVVFPGEERYVTFLEDWASISRGVFQPENIIEDWRGDQGPIWVEFRHRGEQVRLQPQYSGNYADATILKQVNEMIADSGIRFEVYDTHGDATAFVVALSSEEKVTLERERRWKFNS